MKLMYTCALALAAATFALPLKAQDDAAHTLFTNVPVFDDQNEALIENANVIVTGYTIFRSKVTL